MEDTVTCTFKLKPQNICYILKTKPTKCTDFSNLFFGVQLYMFRTVPLSIIVAMLYVIQLSANLYDIHHFCVYSEKLLMMDRGTFRNM